MAKNKKNFILILTSFLFIGLWLKSYTQNLFTTEPLVKVRIVNSLDRLDITFLGSWKIDCGQDSNLIFNQNDNLLLTNENGKIKMQSTKWDSLVCTNEITLQSWSENATVSIADIPYGVGWWWEGKEDRTYEGLIKVYTAANNLFEVVIILPMEAYLKGVVPYEMGGDSPLEALKAQAVAARSEAIMALKSGIYSGNHYNLTSDVECQVFSGNKKRTPDSDRAAQETRGIILAEKGEPINAYYASNCGGHSELISNVWPDRPAPQSYKIALKDNKKRHELDLSTEDSVRAWIFSQPDVYCNPNLNMDLPSWSQKNFRWKKTFSTDSLSKMLSSNNDFGKLKEILPLKRGRSGRIYLCRFVFEKDSFEVNGELAIRMLWQPALRSACFVIDQEGDHFVLNGAGWGHGVGMCQSGAVSQANSGMDYKSILKHYYPGAELKSIYPEHSEN